MIEKLSYKDLKKEFEPSNFEFETIKDVTLCNNIIGQDRAVKSLEFGLNVKNKGYNIYVSGENGSGKTKFSKELALKKAKSEKIPDDLCYVYNFKDPKSPKPLLLEAGTAITLKIDIEEMISQITYELQELFTTKEFKEKKLSVVKFYQNERELIIKEITEAAKLKNFGVKTSATGIYFMPIVNDEVISEEQFEELSEEEKEHIAINSEEIQDKATEVMRIIKNLEKKTRKEISELEYTECLLSVGFFVGILLEKYSKYQNVVEYLLDLKEEILNNYDDFLEDENEEEDAIQSLLPWYNKKNNEDALNKYRINILVDNSKLEGAPVILDYNPIYSNLVGEIEFDNEYGNMSTDFMKIKPGILHKANGGYLILQAHDVLTNLHSWETIRRILKTGELYIEQLKEYSTGLSVSCIKPEPIKLDVKIILVGSSFYYYLLDSYDDEFCELFRINAEFDYEMKNDFLNIKDMIGFIKKFTEDQKNIDFDREAIIKIMEFSTRISEKQNKLTARLSEVLEILTESATWAKMDNENIVTKKYIDKALEERDYRNNMYEEKLNDMIDKNIVMIDTVGKKIGQINGLAVLETNNYIFGKPTRITATTYIGRQGVVNIEKEADMSGCIHDKGVQVLSGYLGQTYAQDFPLSLSSKICFEQNYNGIDGDSASSTELYAILSSLSGLPISQEIAVTGSINQFGDIQPIGGVTYKIEGFFDICKSRGLTGNQAVIIPIQNISDLALKDEVIEAVKNDEFNIYAISHINQGIELLTGVKAGELNEKGKYPGETVHGRAYKKLKDYFKKSIE